MTTRSSEHASPAEPSAKTNSAASEVLLDMYRVMAGIRAFEELSQTLFRRGDIRGSIHLCMGQEAVSAGVCGLRGARDLFAATYRGHGHALALGVDPVALMAEMAHKATGISGGRAGSMNVVDRKHGLLGCFGIIGGSIATATGAAISLQLQGEGLAVGFFGDGAINHGYFYECLNLAAIRRLPVVFVCENNLYGEFTPMASVTAGGIPARPRALGLMTQSVDGQDACAVRIAAIEAFSHVRDGGGPAFIEALTYRFNDHARGDPIDYRPAGEMDAWKKRDPLLVTREQLVRQHNVREEELDRVLLAVKQRYSEIRAEVLAAPLPDPSERDSEFSSRLDRANA